MYSIEEMRKKIDRQGVRLTPQRSVIVDALSGFTGVFSVAELQKTLERSNPDLGRATLFRAIDLFVRIGVLEKVHRESAEDGYIVGVTGHHHHLICRNCGDVRHIDFCPIQDEINEIVSNEGYSDAVHRFEIEGLCASCREGKGVTGFSGKNVRGQGPGISATGTMRHRVPQKAGREGPR